LCDWYASVSLEETDFIYEMPVVMHFEWLFPFVTSSTTWHNIPVEDLHKLEEVCITYQHGIVNDIFSSVPLLLTCCYDVPIEYPCPPDLIESVVVDDFCAHIVTINIDTDVMCEYGATYQIDLGNGYQTTSASSHTVQYASCGEKEVCIKWDISAYGNTREDLEDKTMECCYNIPVPCCCLDPRFEMRRSTSSLSCHNPQYEFYGLYCEYADATWEFSDGTVFIGKLPPPHLFSNFVNDDGIVCVTRTIECCGYTASYTACASDFPAGAYIGRPGQTTRLSDDVPSPWGPRILDLIVNNMDIPSKTRFDGTLQIDMEHTFVNGTWNAGKDFKILVKQENGLQSFRLQGTHIRTLARLGSPYAGCCRWRGVESDGLTIMAWTGVTITDAQIMLHYPAQTAPNSGFLSPAALLHNSTFANNYYAVKSLGQYVSFTGLGLKGDTYGNTITGAAHDEIVCDCAAVNAFDFRNVQSAWPIALNSHKGLSTIRDYEKAFHFENTSLHLRNYRIKDLWDTPHNAQDVPNNPSDQTGIGIDFTWTLPQASTLDIDHMQVIHGGAHTLNAAASVSLQSIQMNNLARGYHLEQYGTGYIQARMMDNLMNLQGNPWASGTVSLFYSPGGMTDLVRNSINLQGSNPWDYGTFVGTLFPDENHNIRAIHNRYLNNSNGPSMIFVQGSQAIVRRNRMNEGSNLVDGLVFWGGGRHLIECNRISGKRTGLHLASSLANQVRHNFFSIAPNLTNLEGSNEVHMLFDHGLTDGAHITDLRWNKMAASNIRSSQYAVDAVTGPQLHTAYNAWLGQFPWGHPLHKDEVFHAAQGIQAVESRYRRPQEAVGASAFSPFHDPNEIFEDLVGTYEAPASGYCEASNDPLVHPEPEMHSGMMAYMSDLVGDTTYWSLLTAAQQAMQTRHILRTLQRHPDWITQNGTLAAFDSSQISSFATQSLGYEQALEDYRAGVAAYQQAANPWYKAADSLNAVSYALLELAWITLDTDSLDDLTALAAHISQEVDSLHDLCAQLLVFHEPAVDSLLQALTAAHTQLSCTETFDCDEVWVLGIHLQRMQGELPDSTETAQLRTIAMQCVEEGGQAVYHARALLLGLTGEYYADADCIPTNRGLSNQQATPQLRPSATLHPNPASGQTWITLDDTWTDASLDIRILDQQGRLVWSRMGQRAAEGTIEISVQGWTAGVYFIHLTGPQRHEALKLMVNP